MCELSSFNAFFLFVLYLDFWDYECGINLFYVFRLGVLSVVCYATCCSF